MESSAEIFEQLLRLKAHLVAELGEGVEELAALDLSVPQAMVLFRLAHTAPMTLSELQAVCLRSQATTSALVSQLERRRLVQKHTHPEDARKVLVGVAPAGAELVESVDRRRREGLARLLARLPAPLQEELSGFLARALDALEAP